MAPVVVAMLVCLTVASAANAAGKTANQPGARGTAVRTPLLRSARGGGSVARQPSRRSGQPALLGRAGGNAVLRGQRPPSPVHQSRTAVLGGPANARTVLTSTVDGTAHRRRF
jgi:hypothetical protein